MTAFPIRTSRQTMPPAPSCAAHCTVSQLTNYPLPQMQAIDWRRQARAISAPSQYSTFIGLATSTCKATPLSTQLRLPSELVLAGREQTDLGCQDQSNQIRVTTDRRRLSAETQGSSQLRLLHYRIESAQVVLKALPCSLYGHRNSPNYFRIIIVVTSRLVVTFQMRNMARHGAM